MPTESHPAQDASALSKSKLAADFTPAFWDAFLASGFLLALDAERLMLGWGHATTETTSADASDHCAFYLPDFYLEASRPWRRPAHWDIVTRERFARAMGPAAGREELTWSEPEIDAFTAEFDEINRGFAERDLKKGVPVVFAEAPVDMAPALRRRVLARMAALPRRLYIYGFWNADEGLLGATPELLFHLEGPRLQTMALAGTRANLSIADTEALLRDPKERYEHQLVVDDLKERLSKLGDVAIGATGVLEFPSLLHLHTKITASLRERLDFEKLVRWLHPTPALGVAPRSLGFGEMRKWEHANRWRHGAPFGVRAGDIEMAIVAIRNVQWRGNKLRLGAGCGLVPESQLDREWAELALKRTAVKRMLGL